MSQAAAAKTRRARAAATATAPSATEPESFMSEPSIEREVTSDETSEIATAPIRRSRSFQALRPLSPVPTYLGIAIIVTGFVLLAIAWGGVAGEANVARQTPYLISGGLTGLGAIIVGVTTVNVAAKRRDSALREQQIQLLAAALQELKKRDSEPGDD